MTKMIRLNDLNTTDTFKNGIFQFYIDAPGCSCIVYFAKADSPFRTLCLKILSNLSKSQNSTDFLRSADAVTTACSLITNQNLGKKKLDLVTQTMKILIVNVVHADPSLTESEERHCISIICLLANDSCNRAKIRWSGAIKRIIEVAKNTKCDDTLSMVMSIESRPINVDEIIGRFFFLLLKRS